MAEISGIILAGGLSKRMGFDKAQIKINGESLLGIAYNKLVMICNEIIVSANNLNTYKASKVIRDEHKAIGPLGGIYSCLSKINNEKAFLLPVDVPNVSIDLIEFIIKESLDFDVTVPVFHGKNFPILGVYKKSVYPILKKAIDVENYSPAKIIKTLNLKEVEITPKFSFYNENLFYNLNSRTDLQNFRNPIFKNK